VSDEQQKENCILLIDSSNCRSEEIRKTLNSAYDQLNIMCLAGLEEALEELSDSICDAVLLHLGAHETDAISALARVMERHSSGPILILTESPTDDFINRALSAGAQDVLRSELWSDPQALKAAIAKARSRHQFVSQLREASILDELTGCYNRRGFTLMFHQEVKLASRIQQGFAILYVDVDNLKIINDAFGHHEGDRAIADTAELLRSTFREADVVSRIGGDEFAVLMIDVGERTSENYAVRLARNLEQFNELKQRPFRLDVSAGVTYFNPREPCSLEFLLGQADAAMYQHKSAKKPKE
jgi:diguanylate cyclase (GGDEF)-like protein